MNLLARYVMVEWKLLFRGGFMWVVLALIGGTFYLTTTNDYFAGDIGRYAVSVATFFTPMTLLLVQFMAVSIARREQTERISILIGTLPYRSWQWIAARLIALCIPFSAVSLVPAAFYVYQAQRLGMAWSSMITGLQMLASFVVPMVLTIVLCYALGTWIRGRVVYLISFAAMLIMLLFGRLLLAQFLPIHWTHGFDIALVDIVSFGYYSELWGFSNDITYWLHRLFFAMLAVLLCGLLVYFAMARRKEPYSKWVIYALSGVAVITMFFCAYKYTAIWNERMVVHQENIDFYSKALWMENPAYVNRAVIEQFLSSEDHGWIDVDEWDGDPQGGQMNRELLMRLHNPLSEQHKQALLLGQQYRGFIATEYDLKVMLEEKHSMKVEATVGLVHNGEVAFDRFPLSLRHTFDIVEIDVNGHAATFEWEPDQDVVWVIPSQPILPQSEHALKITYGGKVDDWRYRVAYDPEDSYWERRAFIDEDRLFLPGFYGWYPYPGNQRIAELARSNLGRGSRTIETYHIEESEPDRLPANFHVVVEADVGMRIMANGELIDSLIEGKRQRVTFQAQRVRGLSLLGGDMTQWTSAKEQAELAVVLSNQIPPAHAEPLVETMLAHYVKLTEVAKHIDSNAYVPAQIYMVRADYPGRMDGAYDIYDHPRRKMIDRNGYGFLSRYTNPAALQFGQQMKPYHEEVIKGTLYAGESVGSLSHHNYKLVLTNAISEWIKRENEASGAPLFSPNSHVMTGGMDFIYREMNNVYDRFGLEGFPDALREIYHYLRTNDQPSKKLSEMDKDFVAFLQQLAGARS